MTNIAPILRVTGRVRRVTPRDVPALPARPAEHDAEGQISRVAREARAGYSVHDVVIDTDPGGLLSVVFRGEAVIESGGFLPTVGEEVLALPVRAYDNWQGRPQQRYRTNGYSFAGAVYAEEHPKGARVPVPA